MVKEIRYTNIKRVLDNLLEHPLLRDLTLEQVVRYTIRFISIHGYSKLYTTRIDDVEIKNFRGILPCDVISIDQVKDTHTGICLRAMTETFPEGLREEEGLPPAPIPKPEERNELYIPPRKVYAIEPAFKTQGRVIYTSFPDGLVEVAYKTIPVDEDGFPLLIDNENYLAALEAYIKKTIFTMKFDTGKISAAVLQNAQQEYAFLAGELQSEMTLPSVSEAEALTRMYNTLIPRVREFDRGFRHLGDREWIRKH